LPIVSGTLAAFGSIAGLVWPLAAAAKGVGADGADAVAPRGGNVLEFRPHAGREVWHPDSIKPARHIAAQPRTDIFAILFPFSTGTLGPTRRRAIRTLRKDQALPSSGTTSPKRRESIGLPERRQE
jgi:hypothetical protein